MIKPLLGGIVVKNKNGTLKFEQGADYFITYVLNSLSHDYQN